jgi:hypothetical protein
MRKSDFFLDAQEGLTSTEALPETDTLDGWTLLEKLGEGCACLSSRLRSVAS